jgi:hypothetical protein
LQHPNAITVHDVIEDDGLPVLVMEYLPSRSLADVLSEHGPMAPAPVAEIGVQAASALAAAHAAGIIHRDIKPGNILLGDDGTVKITDFGISHAAGDVAVTQTGVLSGTPAYLSPEVARGHRPSPSADVFSLGATLYTAVEGTPPFGNSDNSIALLHAVADGHFPPPQHAGPLTAVLMRMLRVEPTERLTMDQARQALQAVATGQPPPETIEAAASEWDTQVLARVVDPISASTASSPAPLSGAPAATRLDPHPSSGGPGGTDVGLAPGYAPTAPVRPLRRTNRPLLYTAIGALGALLASVLLLAQQDTSDDRRTARPAPPTTTSRPLTPAELERMVSDYYALLPEHAANAWTHLSPALQTQGQTQYENFWRTVTSITVIAPPRTTGDNTIHVGIEMTMPDNTKIREFHQLGILVRDSTPLINSDTLLHTERIAPPPPPEPTKNTDKETKREKDEKEDKDDD